MRRCQPNQNKVWTFLLSQASIDGEGGWGVNIATLGKLSTVNVIGGTGWPEFEIVNLRFVESQRLEVGYNYRWSHMDGSAAVNFSPPSGYFPQDTVHDHGFGSCQKKNGEIELHKTMQHSLNNAPSMEATVKPAFKKMGDRIRTCPFQKIENNVRGRGVFLLCMALE